MEPLPTDPNGQFENLAVGQQTDGFKLRGGWIQEHQDTAAVGDYNFWG